MTLSDIAIKNRVFAWMLMIGLIFFGWISFSQMGVSEMPDVDFPVVSVELTWEGAAPEVMETDVVDVVEDVVMSIQGIRDVSSSTRQAQATVTIEFELGRDIDAAVQEVQTKIAQAQRRLPREIDPPIVTKTNPEDQPILWLAVTADRPRRDLMEYVQNHLKDRFQTVAGVGEIFLGGFIDRNLRVWIRPEKLEEYQLSVADLTRAIEEQHIELPAGRIETAEKEYNVRTMGEALTVEEFEKILILHRGGAPIYKPIPLSEVALIEDGLADIRRISRTLGHPAVGLGIRKQRGANAVEVAHRVKERITEVKKHLPPGFELRVNFDSTRFIEESVNEMKFALLLSALLTGLVCWFFLGSWGATVNILMAIPTSIIGSFLILKFAGFTLNTFTVLGLTLAIGIVVDDAIMVLENIVRHRERGEGMIEAAQIGARQITAAAIAATLAVIAIFLPVAFMKGIIGAFFFQFGVTITAAVTLSLLEALTLTPMRCSQFLDVGPRKTFFGKGVDKAFSFLAEGYKKGLALVLKKPVVILVLSLIFFAVSLVSVKFLRKEFVPAQDQSMFLCRLQTPVGSSIEFTDGRFKQAESFLLNRPEIRTYFAAVGGFGGGEVNTGILFVNMKPPRERPVDPAVKHRLNQEEFMNLCRQEFNKIPDVRAVIQDLSMRGFSAQRGFPVEFSVRGPDWEKLWRHAQEIMKKLEKTGLVADLDTDYKIGMPEIRVIPDRQKAMERGVSMEAIGQTINAMIGGSRVGKYTYGGRRYDVRVRAVAEERIEPENIQKIYVRNNQGELIRLSELVTLTEKPTLLSISRKGRERSVGIFANVASGKSQADALQAVEKIAKEILPEGYRVVLSGSAQSFRESFQSLLFALWLGIIISYMVLASQFNSYKDPFVILLALPFSVSGAFLALLIANRSLNVYSMIGLILLMGIVKKNSILLVEFTTQLREQGLSVQKALMEACPIRLRPILMTSISTIAAAVPPALALGPGAESRIPMAIAVIGGVTVSTLLTLFVVPCAYSLLSREKRTEIGT
ncbi:MAG: efflux RND transporter permease subunit [Candidatus Omnitrophica bacterium]|nr:efflux RND transporter permease subunit [Candidatus Omnitrophota bacterium]